MLGSIETRIGILSLGEPELCQPHGRRLCKTLSTASRALAATCPSALDLFFSAQLRLFDEVIVHLLITDSKPYNPSVEQASELNMGIPVAHYADLPAPVLRRCLRLVIALTRVTLNI
jgi:hypothetical protein